jgi:tetratricopeptide (TPR) repeat protein
MLCAQRRLDPFALVCPIAAIADCYQAITLDAKSAMACSNRGLVYGAKGDHDRSVDDLRRALEFSHFG